MLCYENQSVLFDLDRADNRPECYFDAAKAGIFDSVAGVRIIMSLLGIIGSVSIIALALLKKRVFNSEVHPIFMLSLADCALAVLWITGSGIWLAPSQSYDSRWCYAVTLLTVMLECVTINLVLVYAIFAFISTSKTDLNSLLTHINKGIGWKPVMLTYGIAWSLPAILVLLVFGVIAGFEHIFTDINSCTCWCMPTVINIIPFARTTNETAIRIFRKRQHDLIYGLGVLTVLNYIVVFVGLVVLYFKILRRIKAIRKEHDEILIGRTHACNLYGTAESSRIVYGQSRARKRVVIFLTLFLFTGLCNILVTILLISFLVDQPSNHKQHSDVHHMERFKVFISFLIIQSITVGSQGFMNAIAYGWTRDDFVQVIAVPLTNDQTEHNAHDDKDGAKNELEISNMSNADCKSSITETLYPSSIESDVD